MNKIGGLQILEQDKFPLLKRYANVFPITDRTIFAYDKVIYSNYDLPMNLVVHETVHFDQQEHFGLDKWVDMYLNDDEFRLEMEIEAYRKQLEFIKDSKLKARVWIESAQNLSSELYGNLVSRAEAIKLLKT